jgi:predicted phosphodiesterase
MKLETVSRQVAEQLLRRHPDAPSRQLGRMLRREAPEVFCNEESARSAIRNLRGAHGRHNRTKLRGQHRRPKADAAACQRWGSLLPPADPTDFAWVDLPAGPERYLILADLHIPYHDQKAISIALAHAEGNCDGVLILGDLVDAHQISHWSRDPRKRNFVGEVDMANRCLDAIAKLKPKATIWKAGNHELRLERYLQQRAPEIAGLCDKFSYRSECELDARGILWVPPAHPIRHGMLTLIHGHEWGNRFASPVNAARGAFLRALECTIEGHGHRSSYHAETTLRDRTIRCWSIGCMCNTHPEYRPLGNKWDLGFAYLNTGSEWTIESHTIIGGAVL